MPNPAHNATAIRTLRVVRLGRTPYAEAFAAQRALVRRIAEAPETTPDTLVLLEHPPVITVGRRGTPDHVLATPEALARQGVELHETNRGGDVTYHGPGQIVGYPVFALSRHGRDVHEHMRRIERALIGVLDAFGVMARQRDGLTGVWVEDRKIASIGIAVSHWVAYHGFALNVNPDLSHFGLIVPCGLRGVEITSLERELGQAPPMDTVRDLVVKSFVKEFCFDDIRTAFEWPLS